MSVRWYCFRSSLGFGVIAQNFGTCIHLKFCPSNQTFNLVDPMWLLRYNFIVVSEFQPCCLNAQFIWPPPWQRGIRTQERNQVNYGTDDRVAEKHSKVPNLVTPIWGLESLAVEMWGNLVIGVWGGRGITGRPLGMGEHSVEGIVDGWCALLALWSLGTDIVSEYEGFRGYLYCWNRIWCITGYAWDCLFVLIIFCPPVTRFQMPPNVMLWVMSESTDNE